VSTAGELQPLNGSPSSEHWNVASSSLDENASVAFVLAVVGSGPASIVVSGSAWSSMIQVRLAGGSSMWP
jgi:hypothetical protein